MGQNFVPVAWIMIHHAQNPPDESEGFWGMEPSRVELLSELAIYLLFVHRFSPFDPQGGSN